MVGSATLCCTATCAARLLPTLATSSPCLVLIALGSDRGEATKTRQHERPATIHLFTFTATRRC